MKIIKNNLASNDLLDANFHIKEYTDGDPVIFDDLEEWDFEPEIDDRGVQYIDDAYLTSVKPSDFVEFAIRIPDPHSKILLPFSFDERRYLKPIYDSTNSRLLLKCGRQVEKSTMLGNRLLAFTCIQPNFNALYVSPSSTQTKVFSNDRLKEPIETSEKLRAWTVDKLISNVFQKKFINRSQIVLRYAFLNADRVRGIPADKICIDEIQDIYVDNIPVIEECASHSAFKLLLYSGTPKSLDNTIESIWTNESTQNEWVVPCDSCGGADYRFWNILDEDNIGPLGLQCVKCRALLNPMHPDAQWASLVENPRVPNPFEGYRVPQLMVPWIKWEDILHKQMTYSRVKFFNEVLGLSYDSGTRPLTRQDVVDNCSEDISMHHTGLDKMYRDTRGKDIFMGIDWGSGENTYTVCTLGAYLNNKFTIFYIHRFEARESEPLVQLEAIYDMVQKWNVTLIGTDYGGGFDRNDALIRKFGPMRVVKYQYSPLSSAKWKWEDGLKRYQVNRTEVMSDVFNAIKRRNVFAFPRWQEFERPYAQDMLNIFSEYSEERRCNDYKKTKGVTDDTFHAILYGFLVSQIKMPRPDVFVPLKGQS